MRPEISLHNKVLTALECRLDEVIRRLDADESLGDMVPKPFNRWDSVVGDLIPGVELLGG